MLTQSHTIEIPIEYLRSNPSNANRMSPRDLDALERHISGSGLYPALIVRPHPTEADRFEVLDGHHRMMVLQRLGHDTARCDVWNVADGDDDDAGAEVLLLTLNQLRGCDDPHRRAALLARAAAVRSKAELARLLPESLEQIERLLQLNQPPCVQVPVPTQKDGNDGDADGPGGFLQPLMFFLTQGEKARVTKVLSQIDRDRHRALVKVIAMHEEGEEEGGEEERERERARERERESERAREREREREREGAARYAD
ncbi:MAG: ParB/RepB/Spo0J family partition protein [Phycisphaerales bacterium]